ncbi:nc protein [Thecamonas trahens ATCC 50062]|uniref:ubiquitinyl hydrolase 1 n=1 Tax=Thecamonas trahens ATCC 50062 TaxID=461836 RepID=A0A0L0DGS0_THETB|nr:nc protein [Thecamonas trahens ATCC 50062]KNC51539.1 nc protein [Thecamonas trahens ATCC 50062]|eukprot:XP_013755941.1 nc protein [Thecamonas trahens ATCC 50062]
MSDPETDIPISNDAADGALAEAETESDSADSDDKTFITHWEIENFSQVTDKKIWSEAFEAEGRQWRVLCFPKGNEAGHFSLFLECVQDDSVDATWRAQTEFRLQLVNQKNAEDSHFRAATHLFVKTSTDWGFSKFMTLDKVLDPDAGFLVDDKLVVECTLEVLEQPFTAYNWWNYDSRKETGFVGILNQGATCYMNSLLQTLYHTKYFRKCVYQLPTEEDKVGASIPLALQRLFYNMQFAESAVSTKELTKSFGWDAMESFYQHDVQELNRVLCDNLETKMKGTEVEGAIGKLFEGKLFNYIKCLNVDYSSTRTESFFDVSLDVKGNKNVYDAFEDYVAEDTLDGENQYSTEDYGKQDAVKGIRFEVLPPVLQLHLKRFQYDYQTGAFNKINDRFEFPTVLELDKYLSESADKSVPQVYDLFGVLIHSGGVQGGHYYAFVRPSDEPQWLRFDDDKVIKVKDKQALNENFGWTPSAGGNDGFRSIRMARRYTNAYMLIYVRRADSHWVNEELTDDVIPEHLRERIERENAERAEQEKARREAHLYVNIRIIRDKDLEGHRDVDLVNVTNVEPIKVKKDSTLEGLKKEVEKKWGIPAASQRYWYWLNRKNKTSRPSRIVPDDKYSARITSLFKSLTACKLFLEVLPESGSFEEITPTKANLFFKYYDPVAHELMYVGRKVVEKTTSIAELLPVMREMAGLEADVPLVVYEEIKTADPIMIDEVNLSHDLNAAELGNGDILCFQKAPGGEETGGDVAHPTVPDYFTYIVNRLLIKFVPLEKAAAKDKSAVTTTLDLTQEDSYSMVVEALGAATGYSADHIRLTGFNAYTKGPKRQPLRRTPVSGTELTLFRMLYTHYKPLADTLYYEVLDRPLVEIETKRKLSLHLHSLTGERESTLDLYVEHAATVADVLNELRDTLAARADADVPAGFDGPLRMLEVSRLAKIVRLFDEGDPVHLIPHYAIVRVEPVPADEIDVPAGSKAMFFNHFVKSIHHTFGTPFMMYLRPGEPVADLKARVKARFAIPDEDFAAWKFYLVSFSSPKTLDDAYILNRHKFFNSDYIGIRHANKKVEDIRATPTSTRSSGHSIKIYN